MSDVTRIKVKTEPAYEVLVGRGLHGELVGLLGSEVSRVAVMRPRALETTGRLVGRTLRDAGYRTETIEVPDGEEAKTCAVAASCWSALGRAGFTRSDAIVAVGGGSTTDLAGFVAATFLRGIRVVHVPTTLLAMVDAAVGGKTAINTTEGKNLVGSFHEPAGVVCDLTALETLDTHEVVSGLAEVVKCGFIADPAILDLVESFPAAAVDPGSPVLRELVERTVAVKADIVSRDPREATSAGPTVGREALNYGHTLAHAIEHAERYAFRHGAAVAIGMVYVAELARLAGRLDEQTAARHQQVLALLGLPTSYDRAPWPELHETMKVDKKARGHVSRFVILEALARPTILADPDPALLRAAYARLSG